jgi:hypothetical protein
MILPKSFVLLLAAFLCFRDGEAFSPSSSSTKVRRIRRAGTLFIGFCEASFEPVTRLNSC